MATIAVDIDDSLYSFSALARGVMAEVAFNRGDKILERGAYASWDEWRTPADLLGVEAWMEIIEMCHTEERIVEQTPFPGAVDTLHELVNSGHNLLYISNRAPETWNATAKWLQRNEFPLMRGHELYCTPDAKGPIIRHCQYIIDDRPKTLFEFMADFEWRYKHGSSNGLKERKAFSLMTPYNRGLTDVPNLFLAPTWAVLRHFLIREGVLSADHLTPAG